MDITSNLSVESILALEDKCEQIGLTLDQVMDYFSLEILSEKIDLQKISDAKNLLERFCNGDVDDNSIIEALSLNDIYHLQQMLDVFGLEPNLHNEDDSFAKEVANKIKLSG